MKNLLKDCKHMLWLFKQMILLGFKGNWEGSREARYFMKTHWLYSNKRIR